MAATLPQNKPSSESKPDTENVFGRLMAGYKPMGLRFNAKLERQQQDGVWGIFARESVDEGEELASIPLEALLQADKSQYPRHTSKAAMHIHQSAKLIPDHQHPFQHQLAVMENLDDMRAYATYFSNEQELKAIADLSPFLHQQIQQHIARTNAIVDALASFDGSISRDDYLMLTLNYESRAMGANGFVPVLDCFNHSDEQGLPSAIENERLIVKAKRSLQPGDQVYSSYGRLDLYTHAINYNYFDHRNQHFVLLDKRFNFPIRHQADLKLIESLQQITNIHIQGRPGQQFFTISDQEVYFGHAGPSENLLRVATQMSASPKAFLLALLDELEKRNHVDKFNQKHLPKRSKRFYGLLKKEKEIIAANLAWLKGGFDA